MILKTFMPIQSIYNDLSEIPLGTTVYRRDDKMRGTFVGESAEGKLLCEFLVDNGKVEISFEQSSNVDLMVEIKPKK